MRLFSNIFNRSGANRGKKLAAAAVLFVAVTGASVAALAVPMTTQADAASCSTDKNSIIPCGEPSRSALIAKVKSDPKLQKIYADSHFGLSPTDYNRFITSARPGIARRAQNDIVVDGRVVATGVWSIGRLKSSQGNPATIKTIVIPGAGTFYGNFNSESFASNHDTIPVDVLFDSKGVMQFAVMTGTCANPATGNKVVPEAKCKALQPKNLGNNKWSFTTDVTATNGAKVTKLVYNFGDGATKTTTSPSTVVDHTFTKTSTVRVTVTFSLPGGGTVTKDCTKSITFTPPPATLTCDSLAKTPGDINETTGNQEYSFKASATPHNATITSYVFNIDTVNQPPVNTSATSTSISHTFAPGDHTVSVTVNGKNVVGTAIPPVTSTNCKVSFNVKAPTPKPSNLTCVSLVPNKGIADATTGSTPYTFTAMADTTGNATITSYTFDFGDNSQPLVLPSTAKTVTTSPPHNYAPGSFTATVTVKGKDANNNDITAPASTNCSQPVTVQTPECKPGVPQGSKECFTYTCDLLQINQGDNRTVTITDFKASSTNVQAKLSKVSVDWGDSNSEDIAPDAVKGTTHQYNIDHSTITATAHFTTDGTDDIPATSASCTKPVNFVTPPTTTPPQVEAASVTQLVNTGAGSVAGLFVGATIVGTLGYRLFLARRLGRNS